MIKIANEQLEMYKLSKFPEEIDTFEPVYNLPAGMVIKGNRYNELKAQPTLTSQEENELQVLVMELSPYIIDPAKWNKFAGSQQAMQKFMVENIFEYVEGLQEEWAKYVTDFHYVGEYDEDREYEFQNTVKYKGDLYLALKDVPENKIPEDVEYWIQISTKGEKGDTGLAINMKGLHDPAQSYQLNDGVLSEQRQIYYAIKDVPTGIDLDNKEYWELYDDFIISEVEPSYKTSGMVWIKPFADSNIVADEDYE